MRITSIDVGKFIPQIRKEIFIMQSTLCRLALVVAFILALTPCSVIAQGSLTPTGAPAPTMKTLDQIEARTPISSIPTTITLAGSYYLTGNLSGETGRHGIAVAADNVTIDLNCYSLIGANGSKSGIYFQNGFRNLKIKNGTIQSWGGGWASRRF